MVKVHCTGRLENERVLETTKGRPPIEVKIGSGTLIPGFENGIIEDR